MRAIVLLVLLAGCAADDPRAHGLGGYGTPGAISKEAEYDGICRVRGYERGTPGYDACMKAEREGSPVVRVNCRLPNGSVIGMNDDACAASGGTAVP